MTRNWTVRPFRLQNGPNPHQSGTMPAKSRMPVTIDAVGVVADRLRSTADHELEWTHSAAVEHWRLPKDGESDYSFDRRRMTTGFL